MRNIYISLISIVFLSLILTGCGSSKETKAGEIEEKITLKVAGYGPETSVFNEHTVIPWIKRVEELSDKDIEIKLYPSEQLGKSSDFLSLVQDGVSEMATLQTNHFTSEMPLTNSIGSLPGNFSNAYEGTKAYNKLLKNNKDIQKVDLEDNNIKFLFSYVLSPFGIWSVEKEIRVPSDLKGVKVSVTGKIESHMIKSLGGTPVNMPWSETYEALDRGAIDAVLLGANPSKTSGISEVVNYHLPVKFGAYILHMVMNDNEWESLPEEVQEAMLQASEEVDDVGEIVDKVENEAIEEFQNDGGLTVELTENEKKEWDDFMEEFKNDWMKANSSNEQSYEEIMEDYKNITEEITQN